MSTWIWILMLSFVGILVADQPAEVAKAPVVAQVAPPGDEWEPVSIGDVEGVIVVPGDAPMFVDSLGLDLENDAYWRPTAADVEMAEIALADEAGELEHTRQYAGFMESGERKVSINGFRNAHAVDWRERPVLVDDGGECFFMAIYNVDTDELERFRFNGEA